MIEAAVTTIDDDLLHASEPEIPDLGLEPVTPSDIQPLGPCGESAALRGIGLIARQPLDRAMRGSRMQIEELPMGKMVERLRLL